MPNHDPFNPAENRAGARTAPPSSPASSSSRIFTWKVSRGLRLTVTYTQAGAASRNPPFPAQGWSREAEVGFPGCYWLMRAPAPPPRLCDWSVLLPASCDSRTRITGDASHWLRRWSEHSETQAASQRRGAWRRGSARARDVKRGRARAPLRAGREGVGAWAATAPRRTCHEHRSLCRGESTRPLKALRLYDGRCTAAATWPKPGKGVG